MGTFVTATIRAMLPQGCCCGPPAAPLVNTVATKPASSTDESLVKAMVIPPLLDVTMVGSVTVPPRDCTSGEFVEGPS